MENAQEKWNQILDALVKYVDPKTYDTWFRNTKVVDKIDESGLAIAVQTRFGADYLNKNYVDIVEDVSRELFKEKVALKFVSLSSKPKIVQAVSGEQDYKTNKIGENSLALNPKYSFEQYIVGKSNQFAHSAALAVAESPGNTYNPLFIYGESGMGKTHLMQAIGNFIVDSKRNRRVVHYITAEEFTNQMIESLRSNSMQWFRSRYRNIDVLLVDDIHFLAKKEAIQEEFFHTFNTLYDNKRQIIMTSDRPPKDIQDLERRLVTRFESGLMADLKNPDFETRMAILKKKAEADNATLNYEALEFVSENISSNVRALEGSLIRILAYCSCNNIDPEKVDRKMCETILSDMISDRVTDININVIMNKVCAHYKLTPGQILGNTRKKDIVFPRQVAMYLSNLLIPQLSLKSIAQYYQRKDHTTVLHAKKHIENLFRSDNDFRIQIEKLINEIKNKE